MTRVVLTGAASELGRRVVARLVEVPDIDLVAVDADALVASVGSDDRVGERTASSLSPSATSADAPWSAHLLAHVSDDASSEVTAVSSVADLKRLLEGADAVVHLGVSGGYELDGTGTSAVDLALTRDLLDGAGDAGVRRLVILSSAMVYGAWADNPVPLTEEAMLRPNAELDFALHKVEAERLANEWRDSHPGSAVAVLRPALAVSEQTTGWLASSSWSPRAVLSDDIEDPPMQVVHLDDLAAAVVVALREQLDGPYNVAPDGWLPPERRDELAGPRPRLRLPTPAARRVEFLRHRLGFNPTPPEVLAYTRHPWVVSADRLRAQGWEPRWSNEEAFVAGHPASALDGLSPRRKQELSLAVSAVLIGAVGFGAVLAFRRLRRRSITP